MPSRVQTQAEQSNIVLITLYYNSYFISTVYMCSASEEVLEFLEFLQPFQLLCRVLVEWVTHCTKDVGSIQETPLP